MSERRTKKVVSLRGAVVPVPQADADVVGMLRELLHEAESGNIVGLVYGTVDPFGHLAGGYVGMADAHHVMNAATICYNRVLRAFLP